jgi:hypothetical protein
MRNACKSCGDLAAGGQRLSAVHCGAAISPSTMTCDQPEPKLLTATYGSIYRMPSAANSLGAAKKRNQGASLSLTCRNLIIMACSIVLPFCIGPAGDIRIAGQGSHVPGSTVSVISGCRPVAYLAATSSSRSRSNGRHVSTVFPVVRFQGSKHTWSRPDVRAYNFGGITEIMKEILGRNLGL